MKIEAPKFAGLSHGPNSAPFLRWRSDVAFSRISFRDLRFPLFSRGVIFVEMPPSFFPSPGPQTLVALAFRELFFSFVYIADTDFYGRKLVDGGGFVVAEESASLLRQRS